MTTRRITRPSENQSVDTRRDDRDLFGGQAALVRFAASLAGLSRHARPLALERFQNECLIALDDTGQRLGFIAGQSRQSGNLTIARNCGFHDHGDPENKGLQGTITIQ